MKVKRLFHNPEVKIPQLHTGEEAGWVREVVRTEECQREHTN